MPIFDDFDLDIQKVNGGRSNDGAQSERRESCATCGEGSCVGYNCGGNTLQKTVCEPCETITCATNCNQVNCESVLHCNTVKICTME